MRASLIVAAAATAALVAFAAPAAHARPLEGRFMNSESVGAFTFGEDGVIRGVTWEGIEVHDSFVLDGDAITITASDDHPLCPDAVGVYTFVETDTTLDFTLVSDECERRANGLPSETWHKVGDDPITMEGVYRTPDGVVTMTFGADGQMDGDSPTGVHVRDTFVIEDNVFTLTAPDDHELCPSAVGRYALIEIDGVITMGRLADECELRGDNLDGGQWVKAEGAE